MTTWFTSDPHYWHANVIKYCNRPFKDVGQMNETLLNGYNSLVSPEDTVYFLGDILFPKGHETKAGKHPILDSLNGKKHLILGNHDRVAAMGRYFVSCQKYLEIKIPYHVLGGHKYEERGPGRSPEQFNEGPVHTGEREDTPVRSEQLIILCHYPFLTWNKFHYGSWHLHGHCHGTLPDDPSALRLDVGVDCHNFLPINFDRVAELMSVKTFKPVDQHRERNNG